MQCARAIPVTWLGSGSCQARPSRLNTNEWMKKPTVSAEGEAGCIQSHFGRWCLRYKSLPLTWREPRRSNDWSSLVAGSIRLSACVRFGSALTRWSQRICRGPSWFGGCQRFQGPTAPRASCSWEVPSHKHPLFGLAPSFFFNLFHCQRRIYPVDCHVIW